MAKDYYSILGVSKNASAEEIKKAFRRLAHEHHPDKGGNADRFKDTNEAYQILGDAKKRAQYDQFGSAAFENGGMGAPGAGGFSGGFPGGFNINMDDLGDIGDLFGGMFGFGGGGRGGRGGPLRGQDVETDVTLDFSEAVFGAKKKIHLYKENRCDVCEGLGAEPGSKMVDCKTCNGKGRIPHVQRTILGSMQTVSMCLECGGSGKKPERTCKECQGQGAVRRERDVEIGIPAGIDDGVTLRVQGEGTYPGHGGVAGDLFLHIRVKTHPVFTRDGDAIHSSISIPYSVLSLGGKIDIETIDGQGNLTIPEGTPAGSVFRIRDKGVPHPRGHGRGDQFVTIQAAVQKKLSREQRKALEELGKAGL